MAATPALRQHAEHLASALPPLQVAAERIALTVAQGVHGRRRVGQGETFWQFRRYHPGDLVNKIDWRKSAKSQYLFLRETEWAAAQSVWLWRDGSPSMRYRSTPEVPEKIERAELLTIALAALLVRGGERIALMGSGRRPSTGHTAVNRLAIQLLRRSTQSQSLPPAEQLPRHAHIVLFGDFLLPLPEIEAALRKFANQGVHGHLLQVLDPAEELLPYAGRILFEGLEDEGRLLLSRVESVRQAYVRKFEDHHLGLVDIARAVGWSYARTRTDSPPQTALLGLYEQLSDRFRS
jgi:uncharacterized protein (DUF58 family)